VKLDCGFRADLVVEGQVVVETKCKEAIHPIDYAQLLSHLRLLDLPIGLLINFQAVLLKNGIKRIVNHYQEPTQDTANFEELAFTHEAR
jgi:GxxExxY protein